MISFKKAVSMVVILSLVLSSCGGNKGGGRGRDHNDAGPLRHHQDGSPGNSGQSVDHSGNRDNDSPSFPSDPAKNDKPQSPHQLQQRTTYYYIDVDIDKVVKSVSSTAAGANSDLFEDCKGASNIGVCTIDGEEVSRVIISTLEGQSATYGYEEDDKDLRCLSDSKRERCAPIKSECKLQDGSGECIFSKVEIITSKGAKDSYLAQFNNNEYERKAAEKEYDKAKGTSKDKRDAVEGNKEKIKKRGDILKGQCGDDKCKADAGVADLVEGVLNGTIDNEQEAGDKFEARKITIEIKRRCDAKRLEDSRIVDLLKMVEEHKINREVALERLNEINKTKEPEQQTEPEAEAALAVTSDKINEINKQCNADCRANPEVNDVYEEVLNGRLSVEDAEVKIGKIKSGLKVEREKIVDEVIKEKWCTTECLANSKVAGYFDKERDPFATKKKQEVGDGGSYLPGTLSSLSSTITTGGEEKEREEGEGTTGGEEGDKDVKDVDVDGEGGSSRWRQQQQRRRRIPTIARRTRCSNRTIT